MLDILKLKFAILIEQIQFFSHFDILRLMTVLNDRTKEMIELVN